MTTARDLAVIGLLVKLREHQEKSEALAQLISALQPLAQDDLKLREALEKALLASDNFAAAIDLIEEAAP
ncbi:MAG: hypothetical protein WC683_20785 [bacterium]